MKNISIEIFANQKLESVEQTFNKISLKDGKLIGLITGKYLIGTIDNLKFNYITYDNPPMQIQGTIIKEDNGTRIFLNIKSESMRGQLKAVTYALSYPLIFGILLFSIITNPKSIATYIIGLLSLTIPIIINYFYVLFWYSEPNPELIISRLTKDLGGDALYL